MEINIEWKCPKCSNQTHTSVNIWTGSTDEINNEGLLIAKRPVIKTLYMCGKCSCVFGDPDKFNLITDLDYDEQSRKTAERWENDKKENKK